MIETTVRRKFTGNACLYRHLAAREPRLFLRRNLNTILDAHERLLAKAATGGPYEAMIANERRAAGWDYPTKEMLEDLTRGQKPVLRIDHLRLRLPKSKAIDQVATRQDEGDAQPDWLPNPNDGLRLPCDVLVIVPDPKHSARRDIYRKSQHSTVVQRKDERGDSYFDVELSKPFLIEFDELFVETESGSNGSFRWKRTISTQYSLEIAIQPQDSAQSAELISQLETRHPDGLLDRPPNEGRVRAIWDQLPKCPPNGKLLSLKRAYGHKSLDLKYGMEVSMGWSRRKDSPLERHNRTANLQAQQLPTPSASDVQEPTAVATKQYVIRYLRHFGLESRATIMEGLKCIFCSSTVRERQPKMYSSKSALKGSASSFNRLLLHYWSFHGIYEWEKVDSTTAEDGTHLVTIQMTPKRRYNAASVATDSPKEDISWIAPTRPFDIAAHLAGDESWIGASRPKPDMGGRRGRPRRDAEQAENGMTAASSTTRAMVAPADVKDIPPHKRRKFAVPLVQNVKFYQSESKHPVSPGNMLSDSEDELYDDRLAHSQRRNFTEDCLSDGAIEFHSAFNRHLDGEQPSSKFFVRDAVVRFARKQRSKMRSLEWVEAYELRLQHLSSHGIIGADVVAYCLEDCAPLRSSLGHLSEPDYEVDKSKESERLVRTPQKQSAHRANGKFAKSPINSRDNPDSGEADGSPRSRKPHRWSGGGADRAIIQDGLKQFVSGAGSEPPAQPSPLAKSSHLSSRARTSTPSQTPGTRPARSGLRWEGGDFVRKDDDSNIDEGGSRGGDSSELRRRNDSRFNNTASDHHPANGASQEDVDMPDAPDINPTSAVKPEPSSHTAVPVSRNDDAKRACRCGKPAVMGRASIACDNTFCVRGGFHLACVGLERRVMGWRCEDCVASSK